MIPASGAVVAARMSLVLVTALTLQLGVGSQLTVFGVQGDLLADGHSVSSPFAEPSEAPLPMFRKGAWIGKRRG